MGRKDQEFSLGHVEFESLVRYPSGHIEQRVEYTGLEFGTWVWARDINLGMSGMWIEGIIEMQCS